MKQTNKGKREKNEIKWNILPERFDGWLVVLFYQAFFRSFNAELIFQQFSLV